MICQIMLLLTALVSQGLFGLLGFLFFFADTEYLLWSVYWLGFRTFGQSLVTNVIFPDIVASSLTLFLVDNHFEGIASLR